MLPQSAQLNELIEVTRDGERFYQHALGEVQDAELRALFTDLLQDKVRIIQSLAVAVAGDQQPPAQGGTLLGKLRELYADTRSTLSRDSDATYLEQLAAAEKRLIAAFEDAMADAEPEQRALLGAQIPHLRSGHERLKHYRGIQP